MALNSEVQIEVRTGGNDNNGGGFKEGASGTDFTLQDAAQLALTDLATSGIGQNTLTSVVGGFTAAMIGNLIQIRSGTNVVAGFYEITTHIDTNTIKVDRAPDDGVGGISGGSGDVGGAMGSPGKAIEIMITTGMRMWIKTGTYTMTTSTPGPAGPVVSASDIVTFKVSGYNSTRGDLNTQSAITNKPVLSAGAITGITLWTFNATSNPSKGLISIVADGNSGASNIGITIGTRGIAIGVHAKNCPTKGFSTAGLLSVACEADNCGDGFTGGVKLIDCVAHNCADDGFVGGSDTVFMNCLAFNNGGDGIEVGTRGQISNCISHGNTGHGFRGGGVSTYSVNCVSTDNGSYGFNNFANVINCATRNNSLGAFNLVTFETSNIVLTADPYVNAASDDYRPNDTSGGGAELRGKAIADPGQVVTTDIGGYQHSDPAAGGLLTHPGMSGGARG